MKKILENLKHLWKWCISAEYRDQTMRESKDYCDQTPSEKGEHIWKELEDKLPTAKGVTNLDQERLQTFESLVKELPLEDRKALFAWLKSKVYDCEHNFTEHTTGRIEKTESRIWQIYNSHLEVVNKWV